MAVQILLLAACRSEDRDRKGGGAVAVARDGGAHLPPANPIPTGPGGPLTLARMLAAKDAVRPRQKWDEAWTRLVAGLGEPASGAGGDLFGWYLPEGDTCYVLEVGRDAAGGVVDSVTYGPFERGTSQFEKCAKAGAGAAPAAAKGNAE